MDDQRMDDQQELEEFIADVNRRQRYARRTPRIGDSINQLLARKGYAQQQNANDRQEAWAKAVGPRLAKLTRAGALSRGQLEVIVKSSAVNQELAFQNKQILKKLNAAEMKVTRIKVRVGPIN